MDLDRAANCKAKILIDSLELVSEDPSQYEFFLVVLSSVSILCIISIIINIGLFCWRCKTQNSTVRYSELKLDMNSSRKNKRGSVDSKFGSRRLNEPEMENDWTDSSEANEI